MLKINLRILKKLHYKNLKRGKNTERIRKIILYYSLIQFNEAIFSPKLRSSI